MAYLGKTPSQAVRSRYYFTASGSETSLSPTEVTGLSFTDANYVDVSLNGVALVSGTDYTATPSTNTISGLAALTASDVVEIVVYDTFSVFGGNVNGDFNISGGTLSAEAVTVTGLTTTGNVNFGDNDKAVFGAGSDIEILSNGTAGLIKNGNDTSDIRIESDNRVVVCDRGFDETFAVFNDDGDVKLYHNNNQKLATTSSGIDVTGTVTADAATLSGTAPVLSYSDTDNSITAQIGSGTSDFNIATTSAHNLDIRTDNTRRMVVESDGDISFYADDGTTQGLFWDASTQRLGLGTTSPATSLHVQSGTQFDGIRLSKANGNRVVEINGLDSDNDEGNITLRLADTAKAQIRADGDSYFNGGNVGIGTSTVDSALHIEQNASGVTETSGSTLKIHNTNSSGRSKITIHNAPETASGSLFYDTDVGMLAVQGDNGAGVTFHTNGNNERMRIRTNGAIDFNTTSNIGTTGAGTLNILVSGGDAINLKHTVNGNHVFNMLQDGTADANFFHFTKNGTAVGTIRCTTSSTAYNTSSDHRLKENVADMTGAIDRVKQLAPKRFNFISNADMTVDGFIAHEAQTVVPEAITGTHNEVEVWREGEELPDGISVGDNKLDEDGNTIPVMQGIDQSKLVPLLTAALKESITKIETLETQRADLEARLTALENAE